MSLGVNIAESMSGNLPVILANLNTIHDYECLVLEHDAGKLKFSTNVGTFAVDCEDDGQSEFKKITVNGLDFFRVIECIEYHTIFFDSDGDDLTISAYYNPDFEGDELIVNLKSSYDELSAIADESNKTIFTMKSSPSSIMVLFPLFYGLKNDISIEKKGDVLSLSQDNVYDVTKITPKENDISNIQFEGNDVTIYINQRNFFSMLSTGSYEDIKIDFNTKNAISKSGDFSFTSNIFIGSFVNFKESYVNSMTKDCHFMVDDFKYAIDRLVKMIPASSENRINITKYESSEGVIELSHTDASGSVYSIVCAGKIDDGFSIKISSEMINNLVNTCGVDALKISCDDKSNGVIKFENSYFYADIQIKGEDWLPF
jgi:hypothetical protein